MNKYHPPIKWTEEMDDAVREVYAAYYPSHHRLSPVSLAG